MVKSILHIFDRSLVLSGLQVRSTSRRCSSLRDYAPEDQCSIDLSVMASVNLSNTLTFYVSSLSFNYLTSAYLSPVTPGRVPSEPNWSRADHFFCSRY